MNNWRKNLQKNPVLKALSSLNIMLACLVILFILTFWGTIAQVQQGLYQAQDRFFYSWFFLALGFIPFPGARLVLWVMFLNLLCTALTRFVYKWSQLGILIIHIGLLSYLLAAFVVFHSTEESHLTLMEQASANVSTAYHDWEISVWKTDQASETGRLVSAFDAKGLRPGDSLNFESPGCVLEVKQYFPNARAFTRPTGPGFSDQDTLNASGIVSLVSSPLNKEPEKNIPGGIFELRTSDGEIQKLILYGGEIGPSRVFVNSTEYNFALRHKRHPLPFTAVLLDFTKDVYPGTDTARSFQSKVEIEHDGLKREALIYMNHPLRYKNFTFYQSSYSVDAMGRELSTLAVVKNAGRFLPYAASLITFAGLLIHFLMMGAVHRSKSKK